MTEPWIYKQPNEDRCWLIVEGRRVAFLRAETIAALQQGVVELIPKFSQETQREVRRAS